MPDATLVAVVIALAFFVIATTARARDLDDFTTAEVERDVEAALRKAKDAERRIARETRDKRRNDKHTARASRLAKRLGGPHA